MTEYLARKVDFQGKSGYVVTQVMNNRVTFEYFYSDDEYKLFCKLMNIAPRITNEAEINKMIGKTEKFAIWKDHKVIGYIEMTEKQRNILNEISGIGIYIGYDRETNPKLYS